METRKTTELWLRTFESCNDPFAESDIENDPDMVIDSHREEDEDGDIELTLKKQQHYHVYFLSHSFCL